MPREYDYVGPALLAREANATIDRLRPRRPEDILAWPPARGRSRLDLTYVVDGGGALWISDRRTEHVALARGARVLGAGELGLDLRGRHVEVTDVTNQSTGYCPEPGCWEAVRCALLAAGLEPPPALTHSFEFRRCRSCRAINVIKEELFECGDCEAALPSHWNFEPPAAG